MESTTRLHNGIANTVFQEAYPVFDNTIAFHPTNRVFDADADGRDGTIGRFLWWGEFPSRGLFLGLDDGNLLACIALEAHVLILTVRSNLEELPKWWEGLERSTTEIRHEPTAETPMAGQCGGRKRGSSRREL
jgi:hypothetical protein